MELLLARIKQTTKQLTDESTHHKNMKYKVYEIELEMDTYTTHTNKSRLQCQGSNENRIVLVSCLSFSSQW